MSTILSNLHLMRQFFDTGNTLSYDFRKRSLLQLKEALLKYEEDLNAALYYDLHKSKEEVWLTETGMVISEIDYFLKHLKSWMKPQKVGTNLINIPGKSYIMPEPLGVTLIIAPWNYPCQLLLMPLVGAIAAGNCAVLKPSEYAKNTEAVLTKIITETYNTAYVYCVTGDGATIIPHMMNQFAFNHVFFTGGTTVGKQIYKMAADNLVPATLELGGKSPCIVTPNAHLKVAARRIASIKFSNAGQMCIAPDYLLVHQSIQKQFIEILISTIEDFYGTNPSDSYDFGRIVNLKQFERLIRYLHSGEVVYGGEHNKNMLYIAPAVLQNVSMNDPIMQEEIFGPLLPVLTYNNNKQAIDIIRHNSDPLAFYIFTNNHSEAGEWLKKVPSGNAAVNTTAVFYTNKKLPFGGRGSSGIGRYHGKFSFDTFSHQRAVLRRGTWPDFPIAYPTYKGKLTMLKKLL